MVYRVASTERPSQEAVTASHHATRPAGGHMTAISWRLLFFISLAFNVYYFVVVAHYFLSTAESTLREGPVGEGQLQKPNITDPTICTSYVERRRQEAPMIKRRVRANRFALDSSCAFHAFLDDKRSPSFG